MTIDKSLKVKKGSNKSRNVLTRGERLDKLKENERWKDGDSVLGLAKVRVFKLALRKKKKKKEGEEGAEGAAAPAAGKAAAGKAAAAPAAGKAAAPAKKDAGKK